MCRPAFLDHSGGQRAINAMLLVAIYAHSLLLFLLCPKDFSKDAIVQRLPLNKTEENNAQKGK